MHRYRSWQKKLASSIDNSQSQSFLLVFNLTIRKERVEFCALVPRQGLPQMLRESLNGLGQRNTDGISSGAVRGREQHQIS